jgi:hypothetical protein
MQSSISEGFPDLSMYDGNLRVADVVSDSPVSKLQLVEAREQKLVLKRYPLWFDEQDVLFVHEFNQFLFEGGLNTPRLIPTLQGDTFIKEGS